MLYKRSLSPLLLRYAKFPVVGIFGPRQSGKTTLVREVFNKHKYLNFEDPDIRSFALENPQGFLREFENDYGIILDEFQYVPQILSYIQLAVDEKDRPGYFVLTGSQNFLMNEAITQSLAGRIGILTLLPLSVDELVTNELISDNPHEFIFKGAYPRTYTKGIPPTDFFPSYIHSYVERDVRQLVNVGNLNTFQRFMQLCAGKVGQQLNKSVLASDCGITVKTVDSWFSILEASYILFLLNPYHQKFHKRITKTPKLYFYDTGLACALLNIKSSEELVLSSFYGALFECFIIADLFKQNFNRGSSGSLYYWRDLNGLIEVDCLVDRGVSLVPIEIKSGGAVNSSYFSALTKFYKIAETTATLGYVIYGGPHRQARDAGIVLGWQAAGTLIEQLEK